MIKVSKQGNDVLRVAPIKENILERLNFLHEISELVIEFLMNHHLYKKQNSQNDLISVYFSIMEVHQYANKHKNMFRNESYTTQDIEDAIYYLKRIEALKIEGGFLVTYAPMRITRIETDNKKKYTKKDYEKLDLYYKTKVQQIHIVGEYAEKMTKDYKDALKFIDDYFHMEYVDFLNKYFPGKRKDDVSRNMSKEKFYELFGSLSKEQFNIIKDKESQRIVVGAGPGSGKTKLLVHKLASIIYTEDIRTEQLLMLTFSRAAANEFKSRLIDLIGKTAYYIDIKTFHSYAFDIIGQMGNIDKTIEVVNQAIELINNNEVDLSKITKMVLVIDEAQDMKADEYELIQTLIKYNPDLRVIAVGDDDQNIYEFRGSSSEYMQHFVEDGATLYELTTNFRSRRNIVEYSNYFVHMIKNRIKTTKINPQSNIDGHIKVIKHENDTPAYQAIVDEYLNSKIKGTTAIFTRNNDEASIIYGLLGLHNVHAKLIQSFDGFSLSKMIEFQELIDMINKKHHTPMMDRDIIQEIADEYSKTQKSKHKDLVIKVLYQFMSLNDRPFITDFVEFINESKYEDFIEQNVVYVSTLHKAKGKEFDKVIIYYNKQGYLKEDELRLLYVGITRAKTSLSIHATHNIFSSYPGVDIIEDRAVYDEPERLLYQLSHQDVQLGYFKFTKKNINKINSGDKLVIVNDVVCSEDGKKILKFSNKYKEEIDKLIAKGYVIYSMSVNHIVYWFDKETFEGHNILLPEIVFEKSN
jgi:ATP-dependent DNA helicase RecQ